jgi:hypothetical protein
MAERNEDQAIPQDGSTNSVDREQDASSDRLEGGLVPDRLPAAKRQTSFDGSASASAGEDRETSLTMQDLSLLMREQDADLLESIHISGPNSTGMTPLMKSQGGASVRSLVEIPDFCLDDIFAILEHAPSSSAGGGTESIESYSKSPRETGSHHRSQSRARNGFAEVGFSPKALEGGDESSTIGRDNIPRRALSGEVWSLVDQTDQTDTEDITESSVGDPDGEKGGLARSERHDRQLNEAAQFAEAVGEMPPCATDELQIIEDDHSDDDDDEDIVNATEIRVEGCVSPPPHSVILTSGSDHGTDATISSQLIVAVPEARPNKTRPQWPFQKVGIRRGFLDKLPDNGNGSQDYVYKGIRANPPDIVKSGTNRGNYAQLHRKAWLEVSDKYHRYGKNLRLYYRYWESLACPTNSFFDWLDSKGEAAGQPLPGLDECPRSQLDSDTVLYITNPEVSSAYALKFKPDEMGLGHVTDVDGDPVVTGPDGWIFVLRDNVMYGAPKITSVSGLSKQRFHHSSFFGGKAVAAAGIFISDDNGVLTRLYPHSGHYRPGEAHMQRMLFFLFHEGVDLRTFDMDTQQILHVARDKDLPQEKKGDDPERIEKKKKVESLHLQCAVIVACFLAQKARFIGEGIFTQIHQIRKADVATVTEALELIDDSGS